VARFLLGVVALITLLPAATMALSSVLAERQRAPPDPVWVAGGLLLGMGLTVLRRPNWFLHTLQHEACHLIACWGLGVRVHRLVASDGQGGEVSHTPVGPLRTALIALAPYVLPLLLAPLLVARALVHEGAARSLLSAGCALAYPLHLAAVFHNVRLNLFDPRGDFAQVGRLFALAVTLGAALLTTAAAVAVLWADTPMRWRAPVAAIAPPRHVDAPGP
jgi:hypothetical protein